MAVSISTLQKELPQASSFAASELAFSVIIPTRNEAGNIDRLLTGIKKAVDGVPIEVVFVDDSTDGTPQVVEAKAKKYPDLNVHLIHRTPDQQVGGLGGAVVMGLKAARVRICLRDGRRYATSAGNAPCLVQNNQRKAS